MSQQATPQSRAINLVPTEIWHYICELAQEEPEPVHLVYTFESMGAHPVSKLRRGDAASLKTILSLCLVNKKIGPVAKRILYTGRAYFFKDLLQLFFFYGAYLRGCEDLLWHIAVTERFIFYTFGPVTTITLEMIWAVVEQAEPHSLTLFSTPHHLHGFSISYARNHVAITAGIPVSFLRRRIASTNEFVVKYGTANSAGQRAGVQLVANHVTARVETRFEQRRP